LKRQLNALIVLGKAVRVNRISKAANSAGRISATAAIGALVVMAPAAALAHAAERMVVLTLPTGYYIAGAAAAVALTALAGTFVPRLSWPRPRALLTRPVLLPDAATSSIAALALAGLVLIGFLGSRDPLANLLVLTVWTLGWVGLPLACMLLGNLWRDLEPWTGPARAARRLLGRQGSIGLSRLGHWPAVAGFLAFAWFEIVALAPSDPAVLARAVLAYWLVVFVLAVLEGEAWLAKGEAFTLFFGLVARIAPFWAERAQGRLSVMAGLPGTQILAMPPLPPGAVAFVTLVLASVGFDGLSATFWWLARLGLNPLEFPGRSAVVAANTAGLLAAWAVTSATILGAIALGRRLAGHGGLTTGPLMLSFLPIAAGYHAAHYLTALLTDGQYAVVALGDPLGRGWNPFGLPHHWVSFAFLSDRAGATAIWNAQFALILGAHLLAVVLSLRLTAGDRPIAHLPLTALMVLYTVFGLWLLSTPTGA
jgi:hypothetical protein